MDSTVWCKFWTAFASISLYRYDATIFQLAFQPVAFQIFDTCTNKLLHVFYSNNVSFAIGGGYKVMESGEKVA